MADRPTMRHVHEGGTAEEVLARLRALIAEAALRVCDQRVCAGRIGTRSRPAAASAASRSRVALVGGGHGTPSAALRPLAGTHPAVLSVC
jgi:hypothetical protein